MKPYTKFEKAIVIIPIGFIVVVACSYIIKDSIFSFITNVLSGFVCGYIIMRDDE